jgi:ATP-binding cassette subfamily F protein 3
MKTFNDEGAVIEGKLSTNQHPQEIADLGRRLSTVNKELKQMEDQWLQLTTQLES